MGGLLGGPKGMLASPLKLLGGGGGGCPPPPSSYAYVNRLYKFHTRGPEMLIVLGARQTNKTNYSNILQHDSLKIPANHKKSLCMIMYTYESVC